MASSSPLSLRCIAPLCLARVALPKSIKTVEDLVETLMGKKPELRFKFIQDNAKFIDELDV